MDSTKTKNDMEDIEERLKNAEAQVFDETVRRHKFYEQSSKQVKRFMSNLYKTWNALNQEERKDICHLFYHKFMVHVSPELIFYDSLEYLEKNDKDKFIKFMELSSKYFSKMNNNNHNDQDKSVSNTTSQLSIRFLDSHRKFTIDRFIKNSSFFLEINDEYGFFSKDLVSHMKNILHERNVKAEAMRLEFLSKMTNIVNSIDENVDADSLVLDYMKPIDTLNVHFGIATMNNIKYLSFAVQVEDHSSCEAFPVKYSVSDKTIAGGYIPKKSVDIIKNNIGDVYGIYNVEFIEDTNVYILVPHDNK